MISDATLKAIVSTYNETPKDFLVSLPDETVASLEKQIDEEIQRNEKREEMEIFNLEIMKSSGHRED